MSNQITCKLVTNILIKTCSSLVKMISDGENNFMQNKFNKLMKYRNVLPNHKNANMGSSTVHLYGVDLIDMQIQDLLLKSIFILYKTHKYVISVS